ncbi:glycosyltransferase family 2 protein [Salinimicrobium gaetbulicola]|uniref:Glycosyltransferase family 2 protein n=1 Tax=Salinimicrobium gaetbulicola TaxID=999702 RepID=A0ABW3IIX5_9FLAO
METETLIGIVVPTYNRAHLIGETLNSISKQTYSHWECLIIDDGSSDNTREVVENYLNIDKRFFYFQRTKDYNKGAAGARNYGLDLAIKRGVEFVQFFDDDDIMYPQKLELQLKPFLYDEKMVFTVCKFDKLVEMKEGESSFHRPSYDLHHEHAGDAILSGDLKINTLSSMWRLSILKDFRFNETLSHAEEWELFTRIGYHFPSNYGIVDEYLYSYRKHKNTLTMGADPDYSKRKTSGVIRTILCDYLTKEKIHTKFSILFFAKYFLVYSYNPSNIKSFLKYIKEQNMPWKIELYLRLGLTMAKINRKIIFKLSSWI